MTRGDVKVVKEIIMEEYVVKGLLIAEYVLSNNKL